MLRKQKEKSSDRVCAACARKITIAVTSYAYGFFEIWFYIANLRVDTLPGPALESGRGRIKRISNRSILLLRVN